VRWPDSLHLAFGQQTIIVDDQVSMKPIGRLAFLEGAHEAKARSLSQPF
jgi:hypothetical protein